MVMESLPILPKLSQERISMKSIRVSPVVPDQICLQSINLRAIFNLEECYTISNLATLVKQRFYESNLMTFQKHGLVNSLQARYLIVDLEARAGE